MEQAMADEKNKQRATINIQSALRGHKGRQQYSLDKKEKEEIDELINLSMKAQPISPTATALSAATTVAEQREAGLRKTRSDLGSKRGPYAKKTPEQRRIEQAPAQVQTRSQTLDALVKQPGRKILQEIGRALPEVEEEPMAKTSAPSKKQGKGFRKPPKRQVKVSQEEKNKNRLRLVVAQIQAGNTNPKLIQEVNKLYKDLYDIDGAYMMLKK